MKVKDFFGDFDVSPISASPLHGKVTPELLDLLKASNEQKLKKSIEMLGTKWLVHPNNKVQRKET